MTPLARVGSTSGAMTLAPARVLRVVDESHDTFTVHLDMSDRSGGFHFAPGQFNMLYLYGIGEVPISVSGDPEEHAELVHTIRAVGSVTRPMRDAVARGEALGVRGPYGSVWPLEQARGRDVLIIAGGVGFAPLRSVVYHLVRHRAEYRHVTILYGTRTPADVIFHSDLARWRAQPDIAVFVTVDRAPSDWHSHVGVVIDLIGHAHFDPANTVAMICGPEVMMRFTVRELEHRGVPQERTFVSLERSMKCGVGLCGHCQVLPTFVCKNGPVYSHDKVGWLLRHREI